jgi:hypothetical protein
MPKQDSVPLLKNVVALAIKLEGLIAARKSRRPLLIVGHGYLVRNRRLSQAIARLNGSHAYEARVLLRTMVEIQINYAWIRLRNTYSRSLRFVKFISLERLRLLEKVEADLEPDDFKRMRKRYVSERASVRHLFRYRDKEGKRRWAASWASVNSVESRLREVVKKERPENPDTFLYTMYSDLSATVHGSPGSLDEIFEVSDGGLKTKVQPDLSHPRGHHFGALVILWWTIEALASDARLKKALGEDRRRLEKIMGTVTQPRKKKKAGR